MNIHRTTSQRFIKFFFLVAALLIVFIGVPHYLSAQTDTSYTSVTSNGNNTYTVTYAGTTGNGANVYGGTYTFSTGSSSGGGSSSTSNPQPNPGATSVAPPPLPPDFPKPTKATVDLMPNGQTGSDKSATIAPGSSVSFTWTSTNTSNCSVTSSAGAPAWSANNVGSNSSSPQVITFPTSGTFTYTITCVRATPTHIALTDIDIGMDGEPNTMSWKVPDDWTTPGSSVECIGGGGGGGQGGTNSGSRGGGGGDYAKKSNLTLTPGQKITYEVGAAGIPGTNVDNSINQKSSKGGDTWFGAKTFSASLCAARGGEDPSGNTSSNPASIGDVVNVGGVSDAFISGAHGGIGGGSAGSIYGPGHNGGVGNTTKGSGGGGGGGQGGDGLAALGTVGGNGGNGGTGTGAGAGGSGMKDSLNPNPGKDGTAKSGAGGGGAAGNTKSSGFGGSGGNGATGSDWSDGIGTGGGGGGGSNPSHKSTGGDAGNGAPYGGGGGGGAAGGVVGGHGGYGGQGAVIITYYSTVTDTVKVNVSGSSRSCSISLPPTAPPGSQVSLSWTSNNATSLTVDQGVGALTPVAGGTKLITVSNTPGNYTYTGTMNGGGTCFGGNSTVKVGAPQPSLDNFTATPPRVRQGENTTLTWTGSNLPAQCSLASTPSLVGSPGLPASATSGVVVGPIVQSTQFTLTCAGGAGTTPAQRTTNVTVIPVFQEI